MAFALIDFRDEDNGPTPLGGGHKLGYSANRFELRPCADPTKNNHFRHEVPRSLISAIGTTSRRISSVQRVLDSTKCFQTQSLYNMSSTEASNSDIALYDTEKCDPLPEKISTDDALAPTIVAVDPLQPRTWSKAKKWYLSILLAMLQFSVYVPSPNFACSDVSKITGGKYVLPRNSTNASRVGLFANNASSRDYSVFLLFLDWSTDICAYKRDYWETADISHELDCVYRGNVSNRICASKAQDIPI